MDEEKNLWSLIPYKTRLSLIPLIVNAFIVKAGPSLASLLNASFGGAKDSRVARIDISADLLFLNLCIAVWVLHAIMRFETRVGGEADVEPRILALAGILLTITDLLKLSVDGNRPDIFVYAVFVVVYFFLIPFVGIRMKGSGNPGSDETSALGGYLRSAIQNTAYSLALALPAFVLCSLFFFILNDGINVFSGGAPSYLRASLGLKNPQAFWVINPAALGIAIIQVSALAVRLTFVDGQTCRIVLSPRMWWTILTASIVLNALVALIAIDSGAILYESCPAWLEKWQIGAAKIGLGIVYTSLFWVASGISILFYHRLRVHNLLLSIIFGIILFAFMGAASGWAIVFVREIFGVSNMISHQLVWMHATGFVLAFLGMLAGSRIYPQYSASIQSIV